MTASAHNEERLIGEIVARSAAGTWAEARGEWRLADVCRTPEDEPAACLCGHRPIRTVCVLANPLTGETAAVGRVCVRRFLRLPAADDAVLRGLERVARNPAAALTPEAVEFAAARGWLTAWEVGFARDTCRLKRLTPNQKSRWKEINARVLVAPGGMHRA